jgi:mannitol/fructose-specific phosphotransferase system IIA component (Ntr-type)
VANVRHGLEDKGPDGEPVRLVFLVLSPVGRAEEHLKSLATIAQLMSDSRFSHILEAQETGDALLARLMDRA